MMKTLLICLTLVLTLASKPLLRSPSKQAAAKAGAELERSVLNLTITRAVPDPEAPWSKQNIDMTGHAGVVVGENRVLTQASIVANAVYIQAQKVDDVEKVPMRVVFADFEANLALLESAEGAKLSGVKILPIAGDIVVGSDVAMVSIENERQLRRVEGRVMDVRLREGAVGGVLVPMYTLTGANRAACKSDPIVKHNSLIGLCVVTIDNQSQVLTSGVIAHFLNDKLTAAEYRGFGALGLHLHPVRSPWHRGVLGVASGKGALRVSGVMETSPFGDCIRVDDVLQGVDDISVDHRGFFKHSQWGMMPIGHYVSTKYAGDMVTLKYQRSSKPESCTRVLRRYSAQDRQVPGPSSQATLPHLIFGGLVFQELTLEYLSLFGRDWHSNAPLPLLFLNAQMNDPTLTRRRYLILTDVLADEFNTGYEKMRHVVLDEVNGRAVNSIEELKIQLKLPGIRRSGMEFAQFVFKNGAQIVLPYDGLPAIHKRIAKAYSVSQPSSFFAR